ncbi:MAG TPA: YggT family protein [Anaerolineae bacterium]|jgi:YggT family protein
MRLDDFVITFVDFLFNALTLLVFGRILLSWVPQYRYHPIGEMIYNLTDPIITPFQRLNLSIGMFDLSPMVALITLQILQAVLHAALLGAFGQ